MISNRTIFNCVTTDMDIIEEELTEEDIAQAQAYAHASLVQNEITQLKKYLADTDYVIIKMYESYIQGESIVPLLTEYKRVLAERKAARERINELL